MTDVLARVAAHGVVPVVEIDSVEHAVPLAEALLEAGLGVIEVTFRTPAAAEVIATLSRSYPDLLVGAGTVVRAEDLDRALAADAKFALAPGLAPPVVEHAATIGLPYVPGVMTPSDIEMGLGLGLALFKFFPALPAGGLPFLRAIAAPFALHGLAFIPTGGISQANLPEWLAETAVAAVGGTWIAPRKAIAGGEWDAIRSNARAAAATVRQVRGTQVA